MSLENNKEQCNESDIGNKIYNNIMNTKGELTKEKVIDIIKDSIKGENND